MRVAQAIDEGYLDEDFFEGTEDREELISKVTSYHVVNASYRVFTEKLKELEQSERSVMMSYLRKEKTLDELAGELSIDYESICKKIWRIKRKIGKGMSVIMA